MLTAYATVAIFFVVAAGFVLVSLVAGKLLRPKPNHVATDETYECGEAPVQQAWFNFNPRFYIITLIFIVFDVEIAFIYPVAMVFKRWVAAGYGLFAAAEIALFMGILLVGLLYVWKKGDLEWLRNLSHFKENQFSEPISIVRPMAPPVEPVAEESA
jgi:NADH-quinone oxidoreductase subunit A